ncbi:hypothetical protein RIR_jg2372.t1 [Rhizophagus irregularis DAOM 181602=DAOM 197198]|nr:hypothetical protein RIR_jg2372.t1 [Rhizophagus irregularis DAOM 181602=DAOM 197198]
MARTGKTLLNEKVRNQINSFYKRNNKYEENNEDNPKSELQLQIEKLVINCYQKSQELNNDCYINRNKYKDLQNQYNDVKLSMDKLSFDKKSKLKKEVKTLQETVLTQNFQIKSLKIEFKIEKLCIQFANQFLKIPSDRKDQFLNIDFGSMETICSACFFISFTN